MNQELSKIQSKIYELRGVKVMLDFDLAEIYEVETRSLKQAVRRNIKRFPSDFMFELTNDEYNCLLLNIRSQFVTFKDESRQGKYPKYAPFAFTELGATMLSSVLKSDVAIEKSILIIRAFVAVRNFLLHPTVNELKELKKEVREVREYVDDVLTIQNDINEDTRVQLELVNEALAKLQYNHNLINKPRNPIGFIKPE